VKLSIVIPVYNSHSILEELLIQINANVSFLKEFELILVNDCSPDNSWNIISKLCEKYSFLKGINLRKNSGQHNAIMAGLNHTSGDVVIMMDDDLQHSPKYIEELYINIMQGNDVCYTKFNTKKHKGWKIIGSQFNDYIANILLKKPKGLYMSSFKAISKDIKNEIIKYDGPYAYIDGLILSVTNNINTINVEHHQRYDGEGNYTLISSISLWAKMATGFSILPLRIATYVGGIISFFSFLLLILFVVQKFVYNAMPDGWTSIIVLILFFGGVQLLSIGIIGEYIGRIHLNLNKKAQYIIKEKI
jgi:polyisoprenyl-phosphate glycosyltransferase